MNKDEICVEVDKHVRFLGKPPKSAVIIESAKKFLMLSRATTEPNEKKVKYFPEEHMNITQILFYLSKNPAAPKALFIAGMLLLEIGLKYKDAEAAEKIKEATEEKEGRPSKKAKADDSTLFGSKPDRFLANN